MNNDLNNDKINIPKETKTKTESGLPVGFDRIYRAMGKVEDIIGIISFTFMTIFILLNVLFRFVLQLPLSWGEEAARYLMIVGLMFGLAMGVRDNSHQGMTFFVNRFKGKSLVFLQMLGNLINTATYVLMAVFSIQFTKSTIKYGQLSPAMKVPMSIIYSFIIIGFVIAVIENLILFYRIFIVKALKADEGEEAGVL